jgi:hypothetical protein
MAAAEVVCLGIGVVCDYLINECRRIIEEKSKRRKRRWRVKPLSVFQIQEKKKQPDSKQ